ncbi:MAG: hypothetical protein FRX49_11952 [Trebouxia sp. A1-2]|nr:MAG: hypothetical protein FRX49_11952 [Trebouxia sp. A1-2]
MEIELRVHAYFQAALATERKAVKPPCSQRVIPKRRLLLHPKTVHAVRQVAGPVSPASAGQLVQKLTNTLTLRFRAAIPRRPRSV